MLSGTCDTLLKLIPGALVGVVIVVACVPLGWMLACRRRGWLYRATCCWFTRVAQPLLTCTSWSRRALIIAVNNSAVCGVLVLLGVLGHVAWLGVALLGVSLGIALKLLVGIPLEGRGLSGSGVQEPQASARADLPGPKRAGAIQGRHTESENVLKPAARDAVTEYAPSEPPARTPGRQRQVWAGIGFALNLLEPPAILLSLGLSLGQGAWGATVELEQALALFIRFVFPLLLLAATGEALWLTVCEVNLAPPGEEEED